MRSGPPPCKECSLPPPFEVGDQIIKRNWREVLGPFTVLYTWAEHDVEEGHIEVMITTQKNYPVGASPLYGWEKVYE